MRTELRYRHSPVQLCEVHLPAVNTPQFDQVIHRGIAHQPRPVAPVYQPEVAARAVAGVATHPRRSTWVGTSTVATVLASRVAPGLMDRYLARTAITGQQAPAHDPPSPRTNTWEAPTGDLGAHGEFDDEAHAHSPQAWLTRHRGVVLSCGLALAASAAALSRRGPRRLLASRGAGR